ncbi:MAG: hypothetical protein CM15mV126_040 [uncultured marine virus]|nr:MAG: hypothetical protein CM15mV126_040 [uncultured marine virus]
MFPDNGFQDPPQCMPENTSDDYVKHIETIIWQRKRYFANGKGVDKPAWWLTQTNESHSVFYEKITHKNL